MRRTICCSFLVGVLAGGAVGAQAAFPGRNGHIVFALHPERGATILRDYNPRTRRIRRLTAPACQGSSSADWAPDYSPDGRHIAYLHSDDCSGVTRGEIRIMRANGSRKRVLVAKGATSVAFSPDGRQVAAGHWEASELYAHEVFSVANGALLSRYERPVNDYTFSGDVDWSSRGVLAAGMGGNVHVLRADGAGLRALTNRFGDGAPDWGPSGGSFVYTSNREENCDWCFEGGWIVRAWPRTGVTKVRSRRYSYSPVISPRGGRIAYTDGRALYWMGLNRGRPKRLTPRFRNVGIDSEWEIDWQPLR